MNKFEEKALNDEIALKSAKEEIRILSSKEDQKSESEHKVSF